MKEAIGILNGWKCPECGRRVKCPDSLKSVDAGDAKGECIVCRIPLLFKKITKEKAEEAKERYRLEAHYLTRGLEERQKAEEAKRKFDNMWDNIFNEGELREVRPATVNFLNKPLLLKWLCKYAIDKDLHLSEVVISFASIGVKHYLKAKGLLK
jgi:hypothetical protein